MVKHVHMTKIMHVIMQLTRFWDAALMPFNFFSVSFFIHVNQIKLCIKSVFTIALHSEIEHFKSSKIFILLSTIMTWAMTKPADPVSVAFKYIIQ